MGILNNDQSVSQKRYPAIKEFLIPRSWDYEINARIAVTSFVVSEVKLSGRHSTGEAGSRYNG